MFWAPLIIALFVRLVGLAHNPPGLYWEEVALGYDGYSIWKTGADHHGNPWPLVAFESFGDWKPSLYFYVVAPFVGLGGLNSWAVRLPSVLAGMGIVIGIGFLSQQLALSLSLKKPAQLSWWAMLITAINPWAIQFSRAAWEVNLASCLLLWGVIMIIHFWHSAKNSYLFCSALCFILSMYAYHATRVIAPILGMTGLIIALYLNKKQIINNLLEQKIRATLGIIVLVLMLVPIGTQLLSSSVTQRFAETSILSDIKPITESNLFKELSGNGWLSRLLFHRYLMSGKEIVQNFFSHFSLDFLFISGDINPRHSVGYTGLFYLPDALLLCGGIYKLWRHKKSPLLWFLFVWLMVGIVPAALTQPTPHALRILPTLPVWIVIIAFGWIKLWEAVGGFSRNEFWFKIKPVIQMLVGGVYLFFIVGYFHYYWQIYPHKSASHWQAGYPNLIKEIQSATNNNPNNLIYVSRSWGRPAMFYWFYTATDPKRVQAQENLVLKDQGEFLEFDNLRFDNSKLFSNQDIMWRIDSNE